MRRDGRDTRSKDRASASTVYAWAATLAILDSTEFLAQPFVWRNWPVRDMLGGWLHVAFDRLLVAMCVAACLAASGLLAPKRGVRRIVVLALALACGVALGEGLRGLADPFAERPDLLAFAARIGRWTLIAAAGLGILASWRLHNDAATVAAEAAAGEARSRRLLTALELEALQRQIEPHFLFNTLATIKHLGRTSPPEGGALLDRLLDYVSRSFAASKRRDSTLGDELDLVRAYLDVCEARLGPRLRIVERVEPDLRAAWFPPLMLGTLVENAIRHGLTPAPDGGTITLRAVDRQGSLEVSVADDGVGLRGDGGAGIGLSNLAAQLRLLPCGRASLRLDAVRPHGFRATLSLPHAAVRP